LELTFFQIKVFRDQAVARRDLPKQIAMLKMMSTIDRDAQRIKSEHANTLEDKSEGSESSEGSRICGFIIEYETKSFPRPLYL